MKRFALPLFAALALIGCGDDSPANPPATQAAQDGLPGIWEQGRQLLVLESDGDLFLPADPQRQGLKWQRDGKQLTLQYLDNQAMAVGSQTFTASQEGDHLTLSHGDDDNPLAGEYQRNPRALASLSGDIRLPEHSTLPEAAILSVTLRDQDADDDSAPLARRLIRLQDEKTPGFRLYFRPDRIEKGHAYGLEGHVLAGDALYFRTPAPLPVNLDQPDRAITLALTPAITGNHGLRGNLVVYPGGSTFTPCGTDRHLQLDGPRKAALLDAYRQQNHKPLAPMVVRLQGPVEPRPGDTPGSTRATLMVQHFDTDSGDAACEQPTASLTNTYWRLVYLGDTAVQGGQRQAHLVLQDDGKLHGSTGCNKLAGRYQHQGDTLTVEGLASTKMACSDAPHENSFNQALAASQRAEIDGQLLTLFNQHDQPVASFLATYLF
ncbi:hypothetical protein A11A3_03529 [Alcanivorax hongdengensis A-11-3]|uniref:DUF306 domain-containing protein n=1 Tax=Alcanivorax hongdengensis A-11-3 TaxID=1177179 RepID=L0WEG7_9GAMM|nr:META domain-containing protein [Alcanivorax hongdengensis]EKF75396.1 hypothetical protein A11A3_03529 [Alcanivorax hongdengensis A-11-3]